MFFTKMNLQLCNQICWEPLKELILLMVIVLTLLDLCWFALVCGGAELAGWLPVVGRPMVLAQVRSAHVM